MPIGGRFQYSAVYTSYNAGKYSIIAHYVGRIIDTNNGNLDNWVDYSWNGAYMRCVNGLVYHQNADGTGGPMHDRN